MKLELSDPVVNANARVHRELLVVWQDPSSRRFIPVAELSQLSDGTFAFRYLPAALVAPNFFALVEYPDLERTYVSETLPVFFANRVMSPDRYNYAQYLGWLGLEAADPKDVPIEVLARTGGGRATDTFHLVDRPLRDESEFVSRFFISGIRYVESSDEITSALRAGDRLELRRQPDNPINRRAVIVDVDNGQQLGWVPDWLCGEVSDLLDAGWRLQLVAERVNPSAPAHTRVLCLLRGDRY